MRMLFVLPLLLIATPALAQFPPPGIYACADASGKALGTLSLLVAGDYQWQPTGGATASGQIASAADSVTALSGELADQHWRGIFSTAAGETVFQFSTDAGAVSCR